MSTVYFQSRRQAGEQAAKEFMQFKGEPLTVVCLDTDSLLVGALLAQALRCSLQLYISDEVAVPGNLEIGSINSEGGFSYNSNLGKFEIEGIYQEFSSYIEDAKRRVFSELNRELGSRTVIRKDLLQNSSIIAVADCLTSAVPLDSFLEYLKPVKYQKLYVCAPVVMANLMSHIKQVSDFAYVAGTIDFFYGKDHYFEDNSAYDRQGGISAVDNYLKLWPAAA